MSIRKMRAFTQYGHSCNLDMHSLEDDFLEEFVPGDSILSSLKRYLYRLTVPSLNFCRIATHIRSYNAIMTESRRQIQNYPFRIHPYSYGKVVWLIIICIIIILELITVPLDCLFSVQKRTIILETYWIGFRFLLDVIYFFDVVINLMTGFYDPIKMLIIMDFKSIFLNYLKGSMIFDVIVSFPTDWHLFSFYRSHDETFLLQYIPSLKLLSIYTLFKYMKIISHVYRINYYTFLKMKLVVVMLAYWLAICCLTTTFIHSLEKRPFDILILEAFCIGTNLINNPEAGSVIVPNTLTNIIILLLLWISKQIYFIYILGLIMQLIKENTSSKYKYIQMEGQLINYMQQKQFSKHLQKRIVKYYQFRFSGRYFNEHEILSTLSEQLKHEIHMQSCRKLVENVVFFSNLPIKLLVQIISCLKKEIYLTNDIIIKANTIGNSMYFISSGLVAVYTKSGSEICHLQDGDYFGEVAILAKSTLRIATVVSLDESELYRLDYRDFVTAILPYPDLFAKIKQIAADRRETIEIFEQRVLLKQSTSSLAYNSPLLKNKEKQDSY